VAHRVELSRRRQSVGKGAKIQRFMVFSSIIPQAEDTIVLPDTLPGDRDLITSA